MCEPISLTTAIGLGAAALGAGASVYGAVQSSNAQKSAANAISAQNQATSQAQQQAFNQRMQASLAQTAGQTSAMEQTFQDQQAAAAQSGQAQMGALKSYQDVLDTENTQAENLRASGDQQAQQLLDQTNAASLAKAQQDQQTQAATLLAANMPPAPAGPQPTDPSGGTNAVANDPANQAAGARRTAEAATNIRDYGSKIGALSAYDAPTQAVNLAVQANKTGIMPAETADYLLRSGSNTRLLPSQVAYQAATGEGQTQLGLIASKGQNALDAAGLSYGNATDIANLGQSDADTLAANKAAQAKQDAAYQQSLGGIVSGVGNLGLYGAAYYGGLGSSLLPARQACPGDVQPTRAPTFGAVGGQIVGGCIRRRRSRCQTTSARRTTDQHRQHGVGPGNWLGNLSGALFPDPSKAVAPGGLLRRRAA